MPIYLNLLEEEQRKAVEAQRDPVKLATQAAGGVIILTLMVALGTTWWASSRASRKASLQRELDRLRANPEEEAAVGTVEAAYNELIKIHEQRFLWAPQLGWLKDLIPANVQMTRVSGRRETETLAPPPPAEGRRRPPTPKTVSYTVMTLDGIMVGAGAQIEVYDFLRRIEEQIATGQNPLLRSVKLVSVAPFAPESPREQGGVRFIIECRFKESA
jgi:hypothetical protein